MQTEDLDQLSLTFNNCKIESCPEFDEHFKVKVDDLSWKGYDTPSQLIKFINFSKIQFIELDENSYAEFLIMYGEKLISLE